MHALRAFIAAQMDRRTWRQVDLVKKSGLSKQVIHGLMTDDREELTTRIDDATAAGLARAFGVTPAVVLAQVGMAMRLPVSEPVVIYDAHGVSDEDLIGELVERLQKAGEPGGNTAASRQAGRSPATGKVVIPQMPQRQAASPKPPRTPRQ